MGLKKLKKSTYFSRSEYYDMDYLETGRTIHEEDNRAINTGLLDIHGNELYRQPIKHKIGFVLK